MKMVEGNHLVLILCSLLVAGCAIDALSYDYSASIECLEEPLKPQYGGGILVNPEIDNGLEAWSTYGDVKIITRRSKSGNNFVVAHSRNTPHGSSSQKIYLHKDNLYTFSAWIQLSEGKEPVTAVFRTGDGFTHAGSTVAKSGCWSMLKGGLTVEKSGMAELYFQSNNTKVEIWLDSVSLQPFTQEEWNSHQTDSLEKVHKRKVKIQALDANGKILDGARIRIRQNKASFPFGSAITNDILTNTAYQNWFKTRFSVTVFENEMKWYSTEKSQGQEDYSVPDAMMKFAQQNGIAVRGHNIHWDDPKYQPGWVNSLSGAQLQEAVYKRINSVVTRYAGQLIAWDVSNENMHWRFFEEKLGANASAVFFQKANQLDSKAVMFLNEYNTIERSDEIPAGPANYLEKLKEIRSFVGNNVPLGIGLESHFGTPNIPYMRSAIDTLASAGVPIWLTELDVGNTGSQAAQYLDQVLREARSHPAVEGIILWAAWQPKGCWRMCLTDNNFKNLPTGDVVDKLISEWKPYKLVGTTDKNGYFETSLFHGDYDVIIAHPSVNSSSTKSFNVVATKTSEETNLHVQVVA